jgi:Domain of unknown function (DUF4260)
MKPAWILRAEGLALGVAAVAAYRMSGWGWGFFCAAFLAPDLGALGYLGGSHVGARVYNLTHTTVLPLVWGLWLWKQGPTASLGLPALWLAHIGFDRVLGFGLQYPDDFKTTHLQKL